mmetsp:Transcript_9750/g.27293  ORF Transcript_9750/g.27293 Transcript_9750/m.27293 type:complete len:283 (-) Transcript_9750:156-1004(-)
MRTLKRFGGGLQLFTQVTELEAQAAVLLDLGLPLPTPPVERLAASRKLTVASLHLPLELLQRCEHLGQAPGGARLGLLGAGRGRQRLGPRQPMQLLEVAKRARKLNLGALCAPGGLRAGDLVVVQPLCKCTPLALQIRVRRGRRPEKALGTSVLPLPSGTQPLGQGLDPQLQGPAFCLPAWVCGALPVVALGDVATGLRLKVRCRCARMSAKQLVDLGLQVLHLVAGHEGPPRLPGARRDAQCGGGSGVGRRPARRGLGLLAEPSRRQDRHRCSAVAAASGA